MSQTSNPILNQVYSVTGEARVETTRMQGREGGREFQALGLQGGESGFWPGWSGTFTRGSAIEARSQRKEVNTCQWEGPRNPFTTKACQSEDPASR